MQFLKQHNKAIYLMVIIGVCLMAFVGCKEEPKRGEGKSVEVEEFALEIAKPEMQLVDVRSKGEFNSGHIKGAMNLDALLVAFPKLVADSLDKNRPVALYCRSGRRSKKAMEVLVQQGFTVVELNRGILSWTGELEK